MAPDHPHLSIYEREQPVVPWRELGPVVKLYVGAVSAVGGLTVLHSILHLSQKDAPLFAALAILSLVMSIAKVNLPVPRSGSTLTICYVLDYTTLLLLGRPAATLVAALGAWSQCTFRCRQRVPGYQTLFSVAALALTMQASGLAYSWLGGESGLSQATIQVEALIGAAAVFFIANSGLVACAVALSTSQSVVRIWTDIYLWSWPGYLVGFSLGAVAAAGISRSPLWLVPFAAVSLMLTYENFKAYVARLSESVTDPLTGLPNVRFLLAHLKDEIARARRDEAPVALLLVDIDKFKSFNDTYGHSAGNVALQQVAGCMQQSIRPYDICARYGGDEFVVVLPGCGAEDARCRAAALRDAVAALDYQPSAGVRVRLTISVGTAVFPADGQSIERLLAAADSRMYQDKPLRRSSTIRRFDAAS